MVNSHNLQQDSSNYRQNKYYLDFNLIMALSLYPYFLIALFLYNIIHSLIISYKFLAILSIMLSNLSLFLFFFYYYFILFFYLSLSDDYYIYLFFLFFRTYLIEFLIEFLRSSSFCLSTNFINKFDKSSI